LSAAPALTRNQSMTATVHYREVQHFHPLIRGMTVAISTLPLVVGLVIWLFQPSAWEPLPLLAAVSLAGMLFVFGVRLVTEVRDGALYVRLAPLPFRRIPLETIRSAEVRTYRPLAEFGGWGIRHGWQGMAYNARGNRGVQLVLANGRRVLVGSQTPEGLLAALQPGAVAA
jgi:hypothetical protein